MKYEDIFPLMILEATIVKVGILVEIKDSVSAERGSDSPQLLASSHFAGHGFEPCGSSTSPDLCPSR